MKRVHISKSWYLCLFKSVEERKIRKIINEILPSSSYLQKYNKREISQPDDYEVLKIFYHKVLDSKDKIEELDGGFIYYTLNSFKESLVDFYINNRNDLVKELIEELDFALTCCYTSKPAKLLANKIRDGAKRLVFAGGTKKHSVLFFIEKESNGLYSFSIENTGDGSPPSSDKNFLTTDNVKFSNLNLEQFTEDFFTEILKAQNKNIKMHDLNQQISNMLKNSSVRGFHHKVQNNGVCTSKCVSAYIHERLQSDPITFRNFKFFMTGQEIKKIEKISTSLFFRIITFFLSKSLKDILKDANEVLKKREKKYRESLNPGL